MLRKLLKYDLKSIYKVLIIFYILSITFALFTRLFSIIRDTLLLNILYKVFSGITISMIINILINNLLRMWSRFVRNIYKDESYLTHTLPVSKDKIYLSKVFTAIITMFTSVIVIGLTLFIAYYSKANIKALEAFLIPAANMYNTNVTTLILVIFTIFFVEMVTLLEGGFMGIIIGHKFNDRKIAWTVFFGFLAYILSQLVVIALFFITGIFDANIMQIFTSNVVPSINVVIKMINLGIIYYLICIVAYLVFNVKLLKKGVNVE